MCSCSDGASAGGGLWVNVKADGVPSAPMTKTEAVASQKVNGGYLRQV